ncbi:MAG: hypothetical protein AAGF45_11565 [Pseudomonadota bacterium]
MVYVLVFFGFGWLIIAWALSAFIDVIRQNEEPLLVAAGFILAAIVWAALCGLWEGRHGSAGYD